jgi:hypothetical protein
MRPLILAPLLACLAACTPLYAAPAAPAPAPAAVDATPAPAPNTPPSVAILPASDIVTGLPYPASCVMARTESGAWLPDPKCTPGAATDAVTPDNIKTTICVKGYSASIRAPQSSTGPAKRAAMKSYGQSAKASGTTELDHLVPLELGGSNDESNLWPEPSDMPGKGFANTKDAVEDNLHRAVCAGKVPLAAARDLIASDWTTAEHLAGLN